MHAYFRGEGLDLERRDIASEQGDSGEELSHAGPCRLVCHAAGQSSSSSALPYTHL